MTFVLDQFRYSRKRRTLVAEASALGLRGRMPSVIVIKSHRTGAARRFAGLVAKYDAEGDVSYWQYHLLAPALLTFRDEARQIAVKVLND